MEDLLENNYMRLTISSDRLLPVARRRGIRMKDIYIALLEIASVSEGIQILLMWHPKSHSSRSIMHP